MKNKSAFRFDMVILGSGCMDIAGTSTHLLPASAGKVLRLLSSSVSHRGPLSLIDEHYDEVSVLKWAS